MCVDVIVLVMTNSWIKEIASTLVKGNSLHTLKPQ